MDQGGGAVGAIIGVSGVGGTSVGGAGIGSTGIGGDGVVVVSRMSSWRDVSQLHDHKSPPSNC